MPHGLSEGAIVYARAVVPGVVTATSGTFTVSPGAGIDFTTIPVNAVCYTPSTTTENFKPVTLTSFNVTTGAIVITCGSTALASGDVVLIMMSVNQ